MCAVHSRYELMRASLNFTSITWYSESHKTGIGRQLFHSRYGTEFVEGGEYRSPQLVITDTQTCFEACALPGRLYCSSSYITFRDESPFQLDKFIVTTDITSQLVSDLITC